MISVIIPTFNEEKSIDDLLAHLKHLKGSFEIIVVDGGSTDGTIQTALGRARVVRSKKGRAYQMNAGAKAARGDILLFLHADCKPEPGALEEIEGLMENDTHVGGGLRFDMDENSLLYRNHVFWSNLRARLTGIYLGDHGIFVKREVFNRVGGYPEIPIMEDVALCKGLKNEGTLVQARSRMTASSRRFRDQGFVKTVLQMWANRLLYTLGVSPERLAGAYADAR